MDFVVQKLWPNFWILINEFSTNSLGDSNKISGLLASILARETPGSRSRALKIHITS